MYHPREDGNVLIRAHIHCLRRRNVKLALLTGETIVVDPKDRTRCSDDCPYMQAQGYRAGDPMDRDKVVWKCGLTGELYPWDKNTRKFLEIRNGLCLKLDPDPEALSTNQKEKAARHYKRNPYPVDPDYTAKEIEYCGWQNFQERFGPLGK